jgi:hypothetical protein
MSYKRLWARKGTSRPELSTSREPITREQAERYFNTAHRWATDQYGMINWEVEREFSPCYGPVCVRCGYSPCLSCDQFPEERCNATEDV